MNTTSAELESGNLFSMRLSRLEFLKQLCLGSGLLLAGCTPLKIIFKAYPNEFKNDQELCSRILRAFVATVIPEAPEGDPNLVRMFTDDYYPFHEYCGFFVADLSSRSERMFGESFDRLTAANRTRVVQNGLTDDPILERLYQGAIFMSQVSFYAGIYDDEKGCPLIDFPGANFGFMDEEMHYADSSRYLAVAATSSGNYF